MIALTHIAVSLLIGKYFGFTKSIWDIILLAFASIYPDVDNPFTRIGKVFRPLSYRLHEHSGHRAFTHSLLFLALVLWGLIDFWNQNITALIIIGIGSHLILDMCTVMGIKLLYPKKKNFILFDGVVITGKGIDWLIGIVSLMAFLYLVFSNFF